MQPQIGRTPLEGVRELHRRERIAELRQVTRAMRRRRMGIKMFAAGMLSDAIAGWGLMIMTGIAHRNWWRAMPAMNLGTAIAISSTLMATAITIIVVVQTARELT